MDLSFFKNLFSRQSDKDADAEIPAQTTDATENCHDDVANAEENCEQCEKPNKNTHGHRDHGRRRRRDAVDDIPQATPEEKALVLKKLENFVQFVARSLVDTPEQLSTAIEDQDGTNVIMISCAKKDAGKLIGKGGKIIATMRIIVSGAANRSGVRASVDIRD